MIKLHILLDDNYKIISGVAGSLNQFSNAEIVVHFPTQQVGTVLYAWVTPSNLNIGERQLTRDAAEDVDDYENMFAYKIRVYPGMTLGLAAQQDTGFALLRVRLGNVLSPLIKIPVIKSLAPDDTEMPPTEVEQINDRLDSIEEELAGDFVRVGLDYDEIDDLDQEDKIYVEREGVSKFITANNMLGGIEANIIALNYESAVGTTIAEPDWARTWFDPIEEIVGNTVVENEPTVLEQMNFTDEGPEINLMAAMLDATVNTNEQVVSISENEVLVAFAGAELDVEQTVGESETEVSNGQLENELELKPGVSEDEYNPYG